MLGPGLNLQHQKKEKENKDFTKHKKMLQEDKPKRKYLTHTAPEIRTLGTRQQRVRKGKCMVMVYVYKKEVLGEA